MRKTTEGIPVVNRQELNLILDRIEAKGIKKGIVLMGKPGTGKTTIARKRINKINNAELDANPQKGHETDYQYQLRISNLGRKELKSTNSICSEFMLGGFEKVVNTNTFALDDLGTEIVPTHFGTSIDLVPHLLQLAYESNMPFGYYTTNLSYEELKERYGARVVDRLQEKCYFFILEDEPFRKLATAEQINDDLQ